MYHITDCHEIDSMTHTSSLSRFARTFGVLIALASSAAGASEPLAATRVAAADHFAVASSLDLNTTFRTFNAGGIGPDCFAAHVPPGTLKLDVAVAGWTEAQTRLIFNGRAEGATEERWTSWSYIERSATSMLLDIRAPGIYSFCVAAQDPLVQLGEYKLTNAYVGSFDGTSGEHVQHDEDPESSKFCQSGEDDDHADTVVCATVHGLDQAVSGEIRNDWGDDHDFFAFELTDLRTVEIAATGETDTFGSLYDRAGYRLAADDDGGGGNNFRIAKTLAPGLYFIRVEGSHYSEGAYNLSVDVSSW